MHIRRSLGFAMRRRKCRSKQDLSLTPSTAYAAPTGGEEENNGIRRAPAGGGGERGEERGGGILS